LAGRGAAADFVAGYTGGIGRSGLLGQSYLGSRLGGLPQQTLTTPFGRRVIDQLVGKAAHESKVGYTTLTSATRAQIAKDAALISAGTRVTSVTWHFFASPITGLGGPSGPLTNALINAGIRIVLH
jgi:filamentous hemagglutinin